MFLILLLLVTGSAGAAESCSSEAQWMVSRAGKCLEKGDVGCAKLKLDPVLEKEPNCAEALFIRGWIYEFRDGQIEKGQRMQQKAQKINPNLSNFWETRAHGIEAKLPSEAFSHFDVQFYGAEDRNKVWDVVKYLNEMYGDLGILFGEFPPRRIPVIVFSTEEFLEAWRAPFIGGFFDKRDGKVRVRVDDMPGGDDEFRHRARHEMTHAFMYQLYPQELPAWFSEGSAEFCARLGVSRAFWKDERLDVIHRKIRRMEWLTLAQIHEVISKKNVSPYIIVQAYYESEALVIWISKNRGDSWISLVINELRKNGGTFDQAFTAVFGVTPDSEMERLRSHWE